MSGQLIWSNTPPGGAGAAAITASGNSGLISVSGVPPAGTFPGVGQVAAYQAFYLSLVTGTPSGTTPTLTLHLDGVDPFGNVIPDLVTLGSTFSLTTTAGAAQDSFGIGITPAASNVCVPPGLQVRWVVTGTNPSYPNPQIALYGR